MVAGYNASIASGGKLNLCIAESDNPCSGTMGPEVTLSENHTFTISSRRFIDAGEDKMQAIARLASNRVAYSELRPVPSRYEAVKAGTVVPEISVALGEAALLVKLPVTKLFLKPRANGEVRILALPSSWRDLVGKETLIEYAELSSLCPRQGRNAERLTIRTERDIVGDAINLHASGCIIGRLDREITITIFGTVPDGMRLITSDSSFGERDFSLKYNCSASGCQIHSTEPRNLQRNGSSVVAVKAADISNLESKFPLAFGRENSDEIFTQREISSSLLEADLAAGQYPALRAFKVVKYLLREGSIAAATLVEGVPIEDRGFSTPGTTYTLPDNVINPTTGQFGGTLATGDHVFNSPRNAPNGGDSYGHDGVDFRSTGPLYSMCNGTISRTTIGLLQIYNQNELPAERMQR